MSKSVPLSECPIGLFVSDGGELCLKTEYGNNEGRIDAYIISSGEFFWGGAKTNLEQRRVMVTPVPSTVEAALAAIPENVYWLLAKGRLRPQEPLYAIQLLKPGTEEVIAEAEGNSIQECVEAALKGHSQ